MPMVQTSTVVIMSRRTDSSSLRSKTFKGASYTQLNGFDDSDSEETTVYDRGPGIHRRSDFKSVKNAGSNRSQFKGSSKIKHESSSNKTTNDLHTQSHPGAKDTSIELSELRSRKSATNTSKICDNNEAERLSYIERVISSGDTLQSLALKYSCQVAELKRINNLIQDQEFYALQKIKVPARQHGFLQEMVENEQSVAARSADKGDAIINGLEANEEEGNSDCEYPNLLIRTVSIRDAICSQSKEAQDFLQKMDKDINGIVESTRTRLSSLDEVKDYLTSKRIQPMRKQSALFSGVDCGIRWRTIIIWVFITLLVAPLLFILFYAYNHSHSNGNDQTTTPHPNSG